MVSKCDSEKKAIFLLSVNKRLSQLDFYTLDSITGLDSLSEVISMLFVNYWVTCVKRITVTTQSKKYEKMSVKLH